MIFLKSMNSLSKWNIKEMQILIIILVSFVGIAHCSIFKKQISYRDEPDRKLLERKVLEKITLNPYPPCYAKMGDEEKTLYIIYHDPSDAFSKDRYIQLINNYDQHRYYLFETKLFQQFDELIEVNGCEQKVGNEEEKFMYS